MAGVHGGRGVGAPGSLGDPTLAGIMVMEGTCLNHSLLGPTAEILTPRSWGGARNLLVAQTSQGPPCGEHRPGDSLFEAWLTEASAEIWLEAGR